FHQTSVRQRSVDRIQDERVPADQGRFGRSRLARRGRPAHFALLAFVALAFWLDSLSGLSQTVPRMPVERISGESVIELSIHPNVLAPSANASVIFAIANVSGNVPYALTAGSVFALSLDPNTETIVAFDHAIVVNSSTIVPADFQIATPSDREILITYLGAPKTLLPGESFAVATTLHTRVAPESATIAFQQTA